MHMAKQVGIHRSAGRKGTSALAIAPARRHELTLQASDSSSQIGPCRPAVGPDDSPLRSKNRSQRLEDLSVNML